MSDANGQVTKKVESCWVLDLQVFPEEGSRYSSPDGVPIIIYQLQSEAGQLQGQTSEVIQVVANVITTRKGSVYELPVYHRVDRDSYRQLLANVRRFGGTIVSPLVFDEAEPTTDSVPEGAVAVASPENEIDAAKNPLLTETELLPFAASLGDVGAGSAMVQSTAGRASSDKATDSPQPAAKQIGTSEQVQAAPDSGSSDQPQPTEDLSKMNWRIQRCEEARHQRGCYYESPSGKPGLRFDDGFEPVTSLELQGDGKQVVIVTDQNRWLLSLEQLTFDQQTGVELLKKEFPVAANAPTMSAEADFNPDGAIGAVLLRQVTNADPSSCFVDGTNGDERLGAGGLEQVALR